MKEKFLPSNFVAENLIFITVWRDIFCFPNTKISNQYSGCFNAAAAGHHRSRIINESDLESYCRRRYLFWFVLFALIFGILLPSAGFAHRGAVDEIDPCRIKVGDEWVHFTAYTPMLTAGKGYCKIIPKVGLTNLVFDYEGEKLRHVSVEFEITKEPEGSRVYYQEPKKILTGTVNGVVDFGKFGPGNYLAHVTIVDRDSKLDKHIPFSVGIEDEAKWDFAPFLILIGVLVIAIIIMLWLARAKRNQPGPPEQTE